MSVPRPAPKTPKPRGKSSGIEGGDGGSGVRGAWEVGGLAADELLRLTQRRTLDLRPDLTSTRDDLFFNGTRVEERWTPFTSPMPVPHECTVPWTLYGTVRNVTHLAAHPARTRPYLRYKAFFTFLRATTLISFDPQTGEKHLLLPLEKLRGFQAPGWYLLDTQVPFTTFCLDYLALVSEGDAEPALPHRRSHLYLPEYVVGPDGMLHIK